MYRRHTVFARGEKKKNGNIAADGCKTHSFIMKTEHGELEKSAAEQYFNCSLICLMIFR